MRVVFMGTPAFAVPTLKALADAHHVVAAYTRPDSASGRGSALRPSAVKEAAERLGIPVRQPESLRDAAVVGDLAALTPDVACVAAYGLIVPPDVLEVPRFGFVNVHASLLPRWRGAAPIERAILAGDELTGVSLMRMEAGLDAGPYCLQLHVPVDELSSAELSAMLAEAGATGLLRALEAIEDGSVEWTPQDDESATYAEKISKSDVALSPELAAADALRRVRASSRTAPSRLQAGGLELTALSAAASGAAVAPGRLVVRERDAVLLGMADGAVELDRVKPQGRSTMRAADWARGARIPAGGLDWSAA